MTSCKKTDDNKKNVTKQTILGFSQLGSESSWRTFNSESIIKAAEENGMQILYDDAQQKQENQIKAIRSFIVYRVDLIAFAPIVEDGWDTVLKEAKDAQIPVIVVDREINIKDKSLIAGFIGEDTLEEGRNAARFLLKKYENSNERLNILEITGTTNSSSAKNRSKGFREILKDNNQFSIIYSESGDFLRSKGKEILGQIIAYNNNELKIGTNAINIIFSHNDSMTLGILEALDNYGIKAGKEVTIISVDGEQKAIEELKKGRLNCIVECNPDTGKELIELVKTVLDKKAIPKITYVKENVYTEYDNLSQIKGRAY